MLLKCCTQYASKLESSSVATGLEKVSFHSNRRAMPKNAQSTIWLHSFHMLTRLYSKPFKLGFSSTWTENFNMYKLGCKETEELGIKLPTSFGSWRKQGSPRKNIYFCFIGSTKASDYVVHNKLRKILKEMRVPHHLTCLLKNSRSRSNRTRHGTND